MRRLIRAVLWRYPGKLPTYRRISAFRSFRSTRELKTFEFLEAASIQALWGGRPVASVVVVIPTYGRAASLEVALRSVLAQTYRDLVVVVLHDGPSEIPLSKGDRVFSASLSSHCGVPGVVRNIAIRATASKYVAFLDDDNEWFPNHLEVSIAALEDGSDVTYTGLERVRRDGSTLDVLSEPFDRRRLRHRSAVDTNTIVLGRRADAYFSRVCLRRWRLPPEDWELLWRLSAKVPVEHIETVTARYYVHGGSYFWSESDIEDGSQRLKKDKYKAAPSTVAASIAVAPN